MPAAWLWPSALSPVALTVVAAGLKIIVVKSATARPIAPAPAKPTPALTGRRLKLELSSAKLANTASPSNTAQSTSTRPHASGVPSLPIAMPTVRLSTQTARTRGFR